MERIYNVLDIKQVMAEHLAKQVIREEVVLVNESIINKEKV